jgi:hypothetical protein
MSKLLPHRAEKHLPSLSPSLPGPSSEASLEVPSNSIEKDWRWRDGVYKRGK